MEIHHLKLGRRTQQSSWDYLHSVVSSVVKLLDHHSMRCARLPTPILVVTLSVWCQMGRIIHVLPKYWYYWKIFGFGIFYQKKTVNAQCGETQQICLIFEKVALQTARKLIFYENHNFFTYIQFYRCISTDSWSRSIWKDYRSKYFKYLDF